MEASVITALLSSGVALVTSLWAAQANWRTKLVEKRAEYLEKKLSILEAARNEITSEIDKNTRETQAAMENAIADPAARPEFERLSAGEILLKPYACFKVLSRVKAYLPHSNYNDIEKDFYGWRNRVSVGVASALMQADRSNKTFKTPSLDETTHLTESMLNLVEEQISATVKKLESNYSL